METFPIVNTNTCNTKMSKKVFRNVYKKSLTFTLCKNSCKNKRNCKHAKKEFQLIYVQMLN